MFNIARKRVGFGLAAGLVIASVVGITSMTASGEGGAQRFYGTITIDLTSRAGTITFTGDDTYTQALSTATPCSTLVSGPVLDSAGTTVPGNLLTFTPTVAGGTSPNVQLPADGLGVTDGANCGDPAGLIGPGETLTVALGNFFDGEVRIGSGSLSIGKTHPRDGQLRLAYDGGPLGGNIPIAVGGEVIEVSGTEFTSITLASTSTQNSRGLSLKSPTSFNLTTPSEFEEAVICSGDPVVVNTGGTAAASATYTRAENGPGKGDVECDFIGVTVQILDDEFVYWDNGNTGLNTGDAQDVRALVEIVWAGVDPAVANDRKTEINYDGNTAGPFFEAQWCTSFTRTEGPNGELILDAQLPQGPIGLNDDNSEILGTVPWCLVSSTDVLVGDKVVRTTEFYGAGDPVGRWS